VARLSVLPDHLQASDCSIDSFRLSLKTLILFVFSALGMYRNNELQIKFTFIFTLQLHPQVHNTCPHRREICLSNAFHYFLENEFADRCLCSSYSGLEFLSESSELKSSTTTPSALSVDKSITRGRSRYTTESEECVGRNTGLPVSEQSLWCL